MQEQDSQQGGVDPHDEESPGDAVADRIELFARRLVRIERFLAADSRDRIEPLRELTHDIIDHVATSDDGDSTTLRLGGLLASINHWQSLCLRYGDDAAAAECARLRDEAVRESADNWRDRIAASIEHLDLETLFARLLQTLQIESAVQLRVADSDAAPAVEQHVVSSTSEDRLPEEQVSSGDVAAPLRQIVTRLQAEISRRVIETGKPSAEQLDLWSRLIADQCDHVLTTLDDASPTQAGELLDHVIELASWWLRNVDTRRRGSERRRVRRRLSRLRAEQQERRLQLRMESRFGRRCVAFVERTVLVLICLVLGLMLAEWSMTLSDRTLFWFGIIDGAACCVFLLEFFVKLSLVDGRGRWFRRHVLIDLLPSIPVGLLTAGMISAGWSESGDLIRAGRAARFLRLPRFVRYVRILRPVVRVIRALGLAARGLDRLVRQYGHVLNCNIILHPSEAELIAYERETQAENLALQTLWARLRDAWSRLAADASDADRSDILQTRITQLRSVLETRAIHFEDGAATSSSTRDIPAQALLDRLESLTPDLAEAQLGEAMLRQAARVIRTLMVIPLRWLPLIRSCVPHRRRTEPDSQLVAEAAQRTARSFRRFYDLWHWLADLYGTVTPSQFVDRLGGLLVKSSFRPAYRLVLFGGFLLIVEGVFLLATTLGDDPGAAVENASGLVGAIHPVRQFLRRTVGTTVLVLGGVCFLVLAVGWWLQRVAREATEFYEKSVQAQFLLLTDSIRAAHLDRDASTLFERVLYPDWPEDDSRPREALVAEVRERMEESLLRARSHRLQPAAFPFLDRLLLLYRDWLDGAMFTTLDTRATDQLLGNIALRQLLLQSGRVSKRDLKVLQQIDLKLQKSTLKGPYVWFHFVAQSLSHSVAALLVDYNRRAVPLHEIPHLSATQRELFGRWLGIDHDIATAEHSAVELSDQRVAIEQEARYVTTAFTALHFLDADPVREQEIEQRFGADVLHRLRRDRSLLIRRTFGTLPMHRRPRNERVVNLYELYESWIAGGRVFCLPLFLLVAFIRLAVRGLKWLAQAVQEIRRPELREARIDAAQSDFHVAVRKINRIRGPAAWEAARLRAMFDPAWLGSALPGEFGTRLSGHDAQADLKVLPPVPALQREIEAERLAAQNHLRLLEAALADGLLQRVAERRGLSVEVFQTRGHLRAAGIAVHADLLGIRSHLFAHTILSETFRTTQAVPQWSDRWTIRRRLLTAFTEYWRQHGPFDGADRDSSWKAVLKNEGGSADALLAWSECREAVVHEGEQRLGEVLIHPDRITEQLLTLRTIQTLTLLDLRHYRDHIHRLGGYGAIGE